MAGKFKLPFPLNEVSPLVLNILDESEKYAKLIDSKETATETQLHSIARHADSRNLPKPKVSQEVSS